MSNVLATGTSVNAQRIDVTRLSGYSVIQAPNHLENIIEQQLTFLTKKNGLSSVNELLNKYGDAVYEVIQKYCKSQDIQKAFGKVIAKYTEAPQKESLSICFNPLIKNNIAYVDKESLKTAGHNNIRTSSLKSLA